MRRDKAEQMAEQQNRNEHATNYYPFHSGRNRWQVRRREANGDSTLIAQ